MDKLTKKGLDGTQLKTIALVLMVLDHIHYFFEFTGCIPTVFSMLGRLSAPLFLFCTVEGFAHTHDRKRYFIRIWAIGAAMAALEFFMIYAVHRLAGHRLAAGEKIRQGHCCHCRRFVLAVCGSGFSAALSRGTGDAHCLDNRGVCHHQPAAHVDDHHGWRLELFAGRRAAVCPARSSPRAADGMGTAHFPV